jgi:hypothetical protein
MRHLKIFEDFNLEEDIFFALMSLSDGKIKKLPLPQIESKDSGDFLLYEIESSQIDYEEIDPLKGRLNDIGYNLLRISESRDKKTHLISILSNAGLKKVEEVTLWDDIKWKKWELSKYIPGADKTRRGQINLGVKWKEDIISIIDGKKLDLDEIEVYVSWVGDEFRFYNETEAELFIIDCQISYFNI